MPVSATPTLKEVQQEITGNQIGDYNLSTALTHVGCGTTGNLNWFANYVSFTVGDVSFITANNTVFAESQNVTICWNAATCATCYAYNRWTGLGATGTQDGTYETTNLYYSDTFSTAYSHFGDDGSLGVNGFTIPVYGNVACIDFYLLPIPPVTHPTSPFAVSDSIVSFCWNTSAYACCYEFELNNDANGAGSIVDTCVTLNSYVSYGPPNGGLDLDSLAGIDHSFRVRAWNGTLCTDWSSWCNSSVV